MIRTATLLTAVLLAAGGAQTAQAQVVYYGSPMVAPALPMAVAPMVPPVTVAAPVVYAPAVAAAPGVRSFYQVKRGGRLDSVAKKVGVSLADLIRLNPLLSPQARLPAGTLVALPIP